MKFFTIMPFVPRDVDFMVREYQRFHRESGLDLLLPSMTLFPEGENPYEKPDLFASAFAELKKKLEGSGIRLGILIQSLIGMGWSSNVATGKFQSLVNHLGQARAMRTCPLDPGFQEYCKYTVRSLAKLGPELFLIDDDTCLLSNDKLECFCPLHLAKFSKKYERDELINLVWNSKIGDPILVEFETIRRQTLEDYCRMLRSAIDSVDPDIPCGLSGAGREQIMFERMALALAGKNEPFVRVGNALYFEASAKGFPRRIWQTLVQVKGCGKVKMILDESDTFPQNRYSKSVNGMHSHITGAILHGLRGSKMWIENFINVRAGRPNRKYEQHMLTHKGFYAELSNAVEGIEWKGPSIPLPDLEKNFHPHAYPDYFTCKEWFSDVLGRLGIPVTFREASDPKAETFVLTGELIKEVADKDLPPMTEKNLFLDAAAAEYLTGKGFGVTLGVTLEKCPHFSIECDDANGLNMRLMIDANTRKLNPAPGAEVLSTLYKNKFAAGGRYPIAPGSVLYEADGRKTAVWAGVETVYTVSPERKIWLTRILSRLAEIPATCMNEQDLMFRCGRMKDGALLAAIINLSYDEIPDVELFCARKPERIEYLTPGGEWRGVEFTQEGDNVLLKDLVCGAYRPLILKLR